MTRQQKRAELRKLNRRLQRYQRGTLDNVEVRETRRQIENLRTMVVITEPMVPKKRPLVQRLRDFLKRM